MPDIRFNSLEEVPEGLREHAKQADGKYVVNVVPQAKLTEFRDRNIELTRENTTLKSFVDTVKPLVGDDVDGFRDRLTKLTETEQKVKDGTLKATDAIEREVNNRLQAKEESHNNQMRELTAKLESITSEATDLRGKYSRQVLEQAITQAVMAADSPINPAALPDVISRASGLYMVDEQGKLLPKRDGLVVYSQRDGTTPLPPSEWVAGLVKEAPYLGKASAGGGSGTGDKAQQFGGLSAEAFNKLSPVDRINRFRSAQQKAGGVK